jgi:hypothetical protein
MSTFEPDEAVLLELGHLTWAAINLEDVIPNVRYAIGSVPDRLERRWDQPGSPARLLRAPISRWIDDAEEVLSGWPVSATRDAACRWLGAAREALEERNSVLHSVPVTGPALEHLPTTRKGEFSRIRLTEEDLRAVRQKLADAREGWVEIVQALCEESQRNMRG